MKVKYRDINTNEIKKATFFEKDYTLNLTYLTDENGKRFCVGEWQLVK